MPRPKKGENSYVPPRLAGDWAPLWLAGRRHRLPPAFRRPGRGDPLHSPRGARLMPYAVRRWSPVWVSAGFIVGMVVLPHVIQPRLWVNVSASMPRGVYLLHQATTPHRGDVVIVAVPQHLEALMVERGYLPPGLPLMKPVVALAGDRVCVQETVTVNGMVLATEVSVIDRRGRALPPWRGCTTLGDAELFLL